MAYYQNQVPPNYVALPSTARAVGPDLEERSHDRLTAGRVSGWLDLRIRTLAPLHVGSGVPARVERNGKSVLVRDMVLDRRGRPLIPGSSIKGAVRSIAEALGGGCDPFEHARCEPTCAICALFGHLMPVGGFLGRIGFDDALPEDPKEAADGTGVTDGPTAFQPRRQVGRRIYGPAKAAESNPVPYSVVDKGVRFRTRLHLVNVQHQELGLILLAAGCDNTFDLRLGGGKFAGFGRVRFEAVAAWLREGYVEPVGKSLDEAAAKMLVADAMASYPITPGALPVLACLRKTLGIQ